MATAAAEAPPATAVMAGPADSGKWAATVGSVVRAARRRATAAMAELAVWV
nr:hypothetical protein [Mycobacterium conspicuum]